MSCEGNHEARPKRGPQGGKIGGETDGKAEGSGEGSSRGRSLPVVQANAAGVPADSAGPARPYWRSLEERARLGAAPGAANEFPGGASELDGVSRRGFMQLLGVSTAIATVGASCRKPNEKIVPFVRRPEEVVPGNALHFATAYALDGYASGLLVESHEGRPTKIEGNPAHPQTMGATSVFDQALILSLYDDDRAKQLKHRGEPIAWRTFLTEVAAYTAKATQNRGAGLRFLTAPTTSPLLGDLRRRILERFPAAKFVSYASTAADGAAEGGRMAFGRPLIPRHRLTAANVILALDSDFLGEGPEQVRLSRELAARREPGPGMNRLYAVEPALSITGAMADHRLRLASSDVAGFAAALCAILGGRGIGPLNPLGGLAPGQGHWDQHWLTSVAADLERNRGRCVVIAGPRQPAAVHAMAAAINVALGNLGSTVDYGPALTSDPVHGPAALGQLAEDVAAGSVDMLVITAQNPAYTAPVDLKLGQLLQRVPNTIYHTLYEDETTAACNTIVPAAHVLESWGDLRASDGTVSLIQPLIAPLWGGISEAQVFAAFVGEGDREAHALLRAYWAGQKKVAADFDGNWERWLADGVVPETTVPVETGLSIDGAALARAVGPIAGRSGTGMEIGFSADPKVYDGRFANNAWLQELPHPITKLTWDNAVMLSDATAKGLDIESGDLVEVAYRDRKVTGPALIVPGHADDVVTLPLGYGRQGAESVARGVGFNAGALRPSDAFWFGRGATVTKTGEHHRFSITQDHWTMAPDGRETPPPAVEGTLAEVLREGSPLREELEERRGPQATIHEPVDYSQQPYKWAMAIDLAKCTGCSACVVACQAENNIPVVGKLNVYKGREMQWLRIDRYFSGPVEDPQMVTQPLACVHCETAPCEYVCPVNATVHSDEGLNEMVYNRCIGTRYCSNNCPYKVRRFNFFDYVGEYSAARVMATNPDVTVRSRGVMEKCTYCVQRIERKRISTRIEGRTIADGELQTACQQGCPTGAIVFGSLNDSRSKVAQLHGDVRRYDLLHELGTRPRTAYLARIRNPNPELALGNGPGTSQGKAE